jgi:hypothetical protein
MDTLGNSAITRQRANIKVKIATTGQFNDCAMVAGQGGNKCRKTMARSFINNDHNRTQQFEYEDDFQIVFAATSELTWLHLCASLFLEDRRLQPHHHK